MFNLPAIGFTMQGDREQCLAVGTDDYVTKPIRVDALVDALLRVQPGTRC